MMNDGPDTFDSVADRDAIGHRVHSAMAAAYLFLLPLTTAGKDIAFGVLLLYAIVRLPNTWRCYRVRWISPAMWALIAWTVVHGMSILWSSDVGEGLEELKAFRIVLTPLVLWPIAREVVALVGAFLAGVAVMNVIQIVQLLGWFGFGLEGDSRARAGLHPIQTGAMALSALVWWGGYLARTTVNKRVIWCVLLAGLAAFGIVISGSRGVWVAAAVTVPLFALVGLIRPDTRGRFLILAVAGLLFGAAFWVVSGDYIERRIDDAIVEYRDAVDHDDFTTSLGQRVVFWRWGWRFFAEEPAAGIGAGSFRTRAKQTPEHARIAERFPQRAEDNAFAPAHPHSTPLAVISATGLIGGATFLATIGLMFIAALRQRPDSVFSRATAFVLLAWLIGSLADCYHLNGHLFGLFGFLVFLVDPNRPRARAAVERTQ